MVDWSASQQTALSRRCRATPKSACTRATVWVTGVRGLRVPCRVTMAPVVLGVGRGRTLWILPLKTAAALPHVQLITDSCSRASATQIDVQSTAADPGQRGAAARQRVGWTASVSGRTQLQSTHSMEAVRKHAMLHMVL